MKFLYSSVAGLVSLLLTQAVAAPGSNGHGSHDSHDGHEWHESGLAHPDLDKFIKTQKKVALQGVLNNIGPDGAKVPGAGAGFVIASPSKVNPDCEYISRV